MHQSSTQGNSQGIVQSHKPHNLSTSERQGELCWGRDTRTQMCLCSD